jgi:hypothetical protein
MKTDVIEFFSLKALAWALLIIIGTHGSEIVLGEVSRMNQDVKGLSKLINLPRPPKAVWWQTYDVGARSGMGPSDWGLRAVLQFDPKDLNHILENSPPQEGSLSQDYLQELHVFFPEKVKLQEPVYNPSVFARSPLLQGVMVRIESSNKILLILHTM